MESSWSWLDDCVVGSEEVVEFLDIPDSVIGRVRDREFVRAVCAYGYPNSDIATKENVAICRLIKEYTWPCIIRMSDRQLVLKVRRKLRQPDVRRALGDAYGAIGFSEAEAIALHVQHMRGFVREVEVDGVVKTVVEKPSYQALKDYTGVVFPAVPKESRVQVESRSVNVHVDGAGNPVRVGPPATRSRLLGAGVIARLRGDTDDEDSG